MNLLKKTAFLGLAVFASMTVVSCDDDNNGITDDTQAQLNKSILTAYANNTVVPTYITLSDRAVLLADACAALYQNPSQANVNAACAAWKSARETWEESEAFLYGPVEDYNVDPHIDTWPLDQTLWNQMVNDKNTMNSLTVVQAKTLDDNVCGFHAIEYVIFRDSEPRTLADIPTEELHFASVLAADLRNHCVLLEASWRGLNNITSAKQAMLTEAQLTLDNDKSNNYATKIITAGESGNSVYTSQKAAFAEILTFCSDISNEVGATKIGDPVSSSNVLDVESWYSWNSITDFANNIRSVKNAYLGGVDENSREATNSVSAYVKSINPTLDTNIKAAIETAITEIEAMPAPFRNNLTHAATDKAAQACLALRDLLDEATDAVK